MPKNKDDITSVFSSLGESVIKDIVEDKVKEQIKIAVDDTISSFFDSQLSEYINRELTIYIREEKLKSKVRNIAKALIESQKFKDAISSRILSRMELR
jgi:hypothetical protein